MPYRTAEIILLYSDPASSFAHSGNLEEYCRTKVKLGLEAYIYAGDFGEGGKGPEGELTTLANDKVEVFAVNIPNSQEMADTDWRRWQDTVRELEATTGLDFFSELPALVQDKIGK